MKSKALLLGISAAFIAVSSASTVADDGIRLERSVSNPPGVTQDPEPEGEHAFIKIMNFHVPAQTASGELTEIVYTNIDGEDAKTEAKAKPLISAYVYGPVIGFDDFSQSGFPGHGRRDAFVAVSLDDGETWKVTNLSTSADKSSFTTSTPIPDPGLPAPETDINFDPDGPVIKEAQWDARRRGGRLEVEGEADRRDRVEIRNAVTEEFLFSVRADREGEFERTRRLTEAPCLVQAGIDGVLGPAVEVENAPADCVGEPGGGELITEYPGDVTNIFHAVAGNKILAAWQSKFCSSGNPAWGDEYDRDAVAEYLGIDNEIDFYLTDLFAVSGSQGSVDYREQEEFAGEYDGVGEVPYNCLWTARGVLREDPDNLGETEVVWFQAERLTSGRRDVNRVETQCVAGGGCAITWQEDPAGLRPGEGEGAGTGWAGATTNSKTDIWYSFVRWEDLDIVDDAGEPLPLADNVLETGRPQPFVPMMIAARLTNNDRCVFPVAETDESYCNDAFAAPYGIKNQCIDSVEIPLGPQGNEQPICVVDTDGDGDGDLSNIANNASSRPRLNLQPRDGDGDGVVDDAWVVVVAEEDKGLGRFGYLNNERWTGSLEDTGTMCGDPDTTTDENCVKADVGKNIWWFSFNLGTPATSEGIGLDYSLVENVLYQGNQLNQPEVSWITGTMYPPMDTADMWDFGDYNYLIFNTEIARRASMMSQSVAKAQASNSALVALPLWKQGTVNQGGPADIMGRRIVIGASGSENPYDFANLVCDGTMLFTDGANPYYPKGLCMAPAINLSGRTPIECETSGDLTDGICPTVVDCVDDVGFGQLCRSEDDPEDTQVFDKLLSWQECPGDNGSSGLTEACGTTELSAALGSNLDDQSWYMPLEISKAHRGFLDGDFVSMIYAWSPNFKLNAVGRDRYELYTRRSFDGGATWTVLPSNFTASDGETYSGAGTVTCETWRDGETDPEDSHVCTSYAAGEDEQSRNVSQLKSTKETILDPRYTPTIPSMPTEGDIEWALFEPIDPTDIRDPSRYFVVFETGDNTTVLEGEAEPLDLNYGRGVFFGDHFQVWAEDGDLADLEVCYPNDPHGDEDVAWAEGTGFCNEFDALEGKRDSLSEEASITSSAYGDFLYAVWGQLNVDEAGEFVDGDAMFRRVWYLDDYISDTQAWALPGTSEP